MVFWYLKRLLVCSGDEVWSLGANILVVFFYSVWFWQDYYFEKWSFLFVGNLPMQNLETLAQSRWIEPTKSTNIEKQDQGTVDLPKKSLFLH